MLLLFAVDVNLLGAAARTAVSILFSGDANLFLRVVLLLSAGRSVLGVFLKLLVRIAIFPSDALVPLGKLDLGLDVSLGGSGGGVALGLAVGRGEEAEGDGDSGVKVQIAGLWVRENTLLVSGQTRRDLLLLGIERAGGKKAFF